MRSVWKHLWKSNVLFIKRITKRDKTYLLYKIIDILFDALIPIAWVYFPKLFLAAILEQKDYSKACVITISFTVISLIVYFSNRLFALHYKKVIRLVKMDFKNAFFKKLYHTNILAFEDTCFFDKMSRANSYIDGMELSLDSMSNLISVILSFIGVSYIIFEVHWIIILLFIISVTINYCVSQRIQKKRFKFNRERTIRSRKLGYLMSLYTNKKSITDIKINQAGDYINQKINKAFEEDLSLDIKNEKYMLKINSPSIINTNTLKCVMYAYFGYLLLTGMMDFSDYSMLFAASTQFSSDLNRIIESIAAFKGQALNAYNYFEFMDDEEYEDIPKLNSQNLNISFFDKLIFKNVYFNYLNPEVNVIKNISFEIKKGEKIAIIGKNGAGKTTLINLLTGLYKPTQGEIIINNHNINDVVITSYWHYISMVFQDHFTYAFSINGNIAFSDDQNETLMDNIVKITGLREKISTLTKRYETSASKEFDEQGTDFSGGEKQKLAIARALFKKSELLIFDEPSSSLDPIAEHDLFEMIKGISNDKTVIFVSHRMSTTVSADRIILIENGEIVEEGNHLELMNKKGQYYEMFNMQSENYKQLDQS